MHSNVVESQWASAIIRDVESLAENEAVGVCRANVSPNNPRWNARASFDDFYGKRAVKKHREFIDYFSYELLHLYLFFINSAIAHATKCHDHACAMLCSTSLVTKGRFVTDVIMLEIDECVRCVHLCRSMKCRVTYMSNCNRVYISVTLPKRGTLSLNKKSTIIST